MTTEAAREKQYQRIDWANADTTDEMTELSGTVRPRKGAGWWGRGPPISIHPNQCMKRKLLQIAVGQCQENPFDKDKLERMRGANPAGTYGRGIWES